MISIRVAVAVFLTTVTCFAQGKVSFANRVGPGGSILNAPVTVIGTMDGPGPQFTAQLLLVAANNSLTPLIPTSTFGTGDPSLPAAIRSQFWQSKVVDVPVEPGTPATFVVHAWLTSFGSYDAAKAAGSSYASSDPFTVTVGGGSLPVADLTTLKAFSFFVPTFPEPSTVTIGILGSAVLLIFCRRR
jgi:hypothetical protein